MLDEERPDWEQPEEEEAPEKLQRKWDAEEEHAQNFEKDFAPCPRCGKLIAKKSFSCLYCGQTVFEDSGLLGKLAAALKRGNLLIIIVGIIILSFVALMAL